MRIAFALLALLAAPAVLAQSALFSPAPASLALTPEQEARLQRLQAEPGVSAIDLVRADASVLSAQGTVRLALPGRAEAVLDASRFERRAADDASWMGRGGDASQAVLVARGGRVTGSIWHDGVVYEVRPLGGGLHALFPLDTGTFRDHDEDAPPAEDRGDRVPDTPPPGTDARAAVGSLSPTIDVIVAYTSDVSAAYADPVAFAQAAVDASNTASDNSAVMPRLRLVHAYETPDASAGSTSPDLSNVQGQTDGTFDEVHALRDQYGADLVALLGPSSSVYGSCGLGYLNSNASSAFTVTAYDCAVGNLSFAHELGHNMGLRHNPEVDGATAPYAYAHGKFQDATGGEASWRTVMAYSTCATSPCTRIPQWSNPDVVVRGSASGDRDLRDNARVLDERGATVAAFRASTVSPPVASVSPSSVSLTLPVDGTAAETVTIANAPGESDLTWSLSLANVTDNGGGSLMAACVDGQVLEQGTVDFFFRSTEGSSELGQSITVPCGGTLTSIATDIYGPADGATWSSTGTLRLYAGSATSGTPLDAISFNLTMSDWDIVEFPLTTPISVNAGDVVTWFFDFDTGALPFTYAGNDLYTEGTALLSSNGTAGSAATWADNDMRFRATFGAPTLWIAPSPVSGVVAPGASAPIAVAFDASGLSEGVYTADLVFATNDPTQETITVPVTLTVDSGSGGVLLVVDGPYGYRYLGAPAAGVTVDDLAAQNMVRGVPGYYPGALPANLHTTYDATTSDWIASTGTGEVLEPGHAFRWLMYDRVAGNPAVSQSVELPFTLSTDLPANTADVDVTLNTNGDRFNFLANPFGTALDLTGINSWPGGTNIVPTIWAYNPTTRRWDANPTSVGPWQGFRVRSRPTAANPRVITIPASAASLAGSAGVAARAPEAASQAEASVTEVALTGIAPNPSTGSARVSFEVPEAGAVRLGVFDVRGREVATLVDGALGAGRHQATLDSGSLAAGVYVVRLEAAGTVATRQAVVVR